MNNYGFLFLTLQIVISWVEHSYKLLKNFPSKFGLHEFTDTIRAKVILTGMGLSIMASWNVSILVNFYAVVGKTLI